MSPRYAIACPQGHRKYLLLRFLADAPPAVGPDGMLYPSIGSRVEVQDTGSATGIDSGVWCPACAKWYTEDECVHRVDDVGNAEVPTLGEPRP